MHRSEVTSSGPGAVFWFGLLVVGVLGGLFDGTAVAEHPQDGPHADLRLVIEDDVVRLNASLNLAFLDEVIPPARESLFDVGPGEAERLEERLAAFYADSVGVSIDGVDVVPLVEVLSLLADPDPAMVALYPRSGSRGLIRATAVLRYPTVNAPEAVDLRWPAYPPSLLIEEEGDPPPMVIDVLVQAVGVPVIKRVSEADPVASWRRDGSDVVFADVPDGPLIATAGDTGGRGVAFGVLLLVSGVGLGTLPLWAKLPRNSLSKVLPVACGAACVAFGVVALGRPSGPTPEQALDELGPRVREVFEPLHANLYRSFEYAEPSDIYDALERSVSGELLPTLYEQVRTSFIQAEQDGLVGTVTGLERGELRVVSVDAERATVEHDWSVDGTVYHFGHSHTRTNDYRAQYDLALLEPGWRIVGQRVLEQRRVDDGTGTPGAGETAAPGPPLGEL
ncbi:MAG: hypothetical protein AAF108_02675 [Planctomycetota bacterium]